jgi:hypothetical protein
MTWSISVLTLLRSPRSQTWGSTHGHLEIDPQLINKARNIRKSTSRNMMTIWEVCEHLHHTFWWSRRSPRCVTHPLLQFFQAHRPRLLSIVRSIFLLQSLQDLNGLTMMHGIIRIQPADSKHYQSNTRVLALLLHFYQFHSYLILKRSSFHGSLFKPKTYKVAAKTLA